MSAISRGYKHGFNFELPVSLIKTIELLKRGFVKKEVNHASRLYHVDYSYELVPDTAIKDFGNTSKIASLFSGGCYIYIFDNPYYQGGYRIVVPRERIFVDSCGSLIASSCPIAIDEVQASGRAPGHYWELTGHRYLLHFYAAYRYM